MRHRLTLLAEPVAVCRCDPDGPLPAPAEGVIPALWSVTRTAEEISVVCDAGCVPAEAAHVETGWRALRVRGPLAFSLVGVIAGLTAPLAAANVPVFVLSTFDTDLLLVREGDLARALEVLGERHTIEPG